MEHQRDDGTFLRRSTNGFSEIHNSNDPVIHRSIEISDGTYVADSHESKQTRVDNSYTRPLLRTEDEDSSPMLNSDSANNWAERRDSFSGNARNVDFVVEEANEREELKIKEKTKRRMY